MSETVGATFGASAGGPRPSRRRRIVNSLVRAFAVVVGLSIAAFLTQMPTWGLWVGVILMLVVLGSVAVLLGMVWRRAALAVIGCVVGFAAALFAGPAAYEQYMRAFSEPMHAVVADVQGSGERAGLNSRRCIVVDDSGTVHRLDQRQNCFDHIRAQQGVVIYQDPLGVLPPRLEDATDRGILTSVTTVIAGILLAATGAIVLGGGVRRRPAHSSVAHEGEDHSDDDVPGEKRHDDAPARMGRVLWLEQRRARRRDSDSARRGEPSGGGEAVWEVRGTDASVQVAEHADIDVLAIVERLMPVEETGDDEPGDTHGFRSLILWADTRRHDVFARVVPESVSSRRTVRYAVNGPQGEPLASITCRGAARFSPRRTCWIVEQAGQPAAVGYQGRPLSPLVRFVTAPLLGVVFLFSLLVLDPVAPKRRKPGIRWQVNGEVVLEYRVGPPGSPDHVGRLHISAAEWDPRVTAALLAVMEPTLSG